MSELQINPTISRPRDEVSLFVRGYCNTEKEDRPGIFAAMLTKGSHQKVLCGTGVNTTTNRMIISGVIEAVKLLTRPCRIKLHTHTKIGLKGKGPNSDLIHQLLGMINTHSHELHEIVSQERQSDLQSIISTRTKITKDEKEAR